MKEITIPQVIIGVLLTAMLGMMTGGFWRLWDIDNKQSALYEQLSAIDDKCKERGAAVAQLHAELDIVRKEFEIKMSDRYTGKDAQKDQETNQVQHTFMWSAINELQVRMNKLHDWLFEK